MTDYTMSFQWAQASDDCTMVSMTLTFEKAYNGDAEKELQSSKPDLCIEKLVDAIEKNKINGTVDNSWNCERISKSIVCG